MIIRPTGYNILLKTITLSVLVSLLTACNNESAGFWQGYAWNKAANDPSFGLTATTSDILIPLNTSRTVLWNCHKTTTFKKQSESMTPVEFKNQIASIRPCFRHSLNTP